MLEVSPFSHGARDLCNDSYRGRQKWENSARWDAGIVLVLVFLSLFFLSQG